ncbi:MAG: exodeoxyribonuclease III [Burkholderiaceae bacterium]
MKIVSANLNGIRSAANKGFFSWASAQRIDALGVQEVKAQAADLTLDLTQVQDSVSSNLLTGDFHFAQKKGYSGVGLYTHVQPSDVIVGIGNEEFDFEGRWIEKRFDKPGRKLSLISSYFPSGSSSDERQSAKFRFLDLMTERLKELAAEREFVLMGDINIAHQNLDLKNWKSNLQNSGFTPEERQWMTNTLSATPLVDVYRQLNPLASETCYTWWSQRGQAYAKNVGWRIDYQLATPGLAKGALKASVFKEEKFSDHAPLLIDYDWSI